MSDEPRSKPIALGSITGAHGLKGWVKVHSDTDPRDGITRYAHWTLARAGRQRPERVRVLEGREQGKTVVARLEGIEDRDAAEALTGYEISVDRDELPGLDDGSVYWTDLIGMDVLTIDGVRIGPIDRLFETGANDVMVVRDERCTAAGAGPGSDRPKGKASPEVLIPWIRESVIRGVDMDMRRITVDWDPDF